VKTVHMIGNAHLDPVWLWDREEGLDAALATVRSACDRLDEFPDFVFTCSASWMHAQVETVDPELYSRLRAHVEAGRWRLVGGMYIEPDCNLPSADSFRRQLLAGQGYFRARLGREATVGYNIDSFGHSAYLPRFLSEAGIDSYVFMRPDPNELELPANLFTWRSPDGAEVLAFRLPRPYATRAAEIPDHVERALAAVPPGIEHTMCFFGVGDHGGGPTCDQIRWIAGNRKSIPGARLEFSHPRAFFDAVAGARSDLPVVEGELQHHAIGCYSVERRIKTAMRRAEAGLEQAQAVLDLHGEAGPEGGWARTLESAWEAVLFNQFHDILGGTSLDSASRLAAAELESAAGTARRVAAESCRRAMRPRAEPGVHRIVVLNPAGEPFEGLVTHEPWLDRQGTSLNYAVRDKSGEAVPLQLVPGEAMAQGASAALMQVSVPARSARMLELVPGEAGRDPECGNVRADGAELHNGVIQARLGAEGIEFRGWSLGLELMDDPTDTWSHSAGNRFAGQRLRGLGLADPEVVENGPLRAALLARGAEDSPRLWCRLSLAAGAKSLRVRLAVTWTEILRMLRLRCTAPAPLTARTDLVSGGPLQRAADGLEYPLGGGMLVEAGDERLGIVAPQVFSASAEERAVNLTLLRGAYVAHHDPAPAGVPPDGSVCDQGAHVFEIELQCGPDLQAGELARRAREMLAPPIVWDLTG